MFWIVVLFLVGLILIIKGGDIFVDAATWIAKKSGIPNFIIGATIVSFATTLPELVASVVGTVQGSLGLAVGNAVGSVTANTGMIMAISIIFMPSIFNRKQYAFKTILLMVITLFLGLLLLNGKLEMFESICVLLLAVVFLTENVISAREMTKLSKSIENNISLSNEDKNVEEVKTEEKPTLFGKPISSKTDLLVNIIKFVLGAASIYFGAQLLVNNGKEIARSLKVSEDIIGLTLVAIGTSLPELVTTITAIVKKQSSLSIGNIVGANIIDMSVILPICAFVSGGQLVLDSMQTVYLDIPASLIVMLIAFIPALITKKFKKWQGFAMLAVYVSYLVIICFKLITF